MRRLSAALIFLLVFSALLCLAAPAFLEADTSRTMIDGLDGLRLLSPEEAKTFPEPSGKVELNHRPCVKPDRAVEQGDVITCRGLGKCLLKEMGGVSKKGRIMLVLERYV